MKNLQGLVAILSLIFILTANNLASQNTFYNAPEGTKGENLTTFAERTKVLTEEVEKLNSEAARQHPEFGNNPYNTTCEDCFEILDKRTANSRYFVKNGSNGSIFYSQASYNDLHYKNVNGDWITIDPLLRKTATDGIWTAPQQTNPTELNLIEGYTAIEMWDKEKLQFNSNISIYNTNNPYEAGDKKIIDLTTYTVGENGAEIINAFSGINQQLIFKRSSVKSNYMLSNLSEVDTAKTFFIIEDQFILPDGYQLKKDEYEGLVNSHGGWYGELIIENSDGIEMARFKRPLVFDDGEGGIFAGEINENNSGYYISQDGPNCTVKVAVSTQWLKSENRVFPLTIDPTVYGTTVSWVGTFGSDETPNWCTMSLNVPTPANATLTGSRVDWKVFATGLNCPPACRLNDVQVQFFTTCDYSPHPLGVWVCPGCNVAGTWDTWVDDATTEDMVSCFTPACAPFDITFNLNINQFNCTTPGTCDITCVYLMDFSVTIEGRTVEVTAKAEGATAYTVVDCADQSGWLSPSTPNYGVPAYTYSWAPMGYTDPSVYVTFPLGTTVYTLTITDACGNTSTDAVTVTNPCLLLPLSLSEFSGYHQAGKNFLKWSAEHVNDNNFIIERSITGYDFIKVGEMAPKNDAGLITYMFDELSPGSNVVYYRIKQLNSTGEWIYSDIIAIKTGMASINEIKSATIDETNSSLTLVVSSGSSETTQVQIFDITGKLVSSQSTYIGEGVSTVKLLLPSLAKGTYVIKMALSGGELSSKFIY